MAELPEPVRAALGLVASVADAIKDGRGLPDGFADDLTNNLATKALELPVLAVSTALQLSLRAQQQYAAMTVRGDELLTQLRGGPPAQPPAWAQFDDEPAVAAPATRAATATPVQKVAAQKVAAPAKKAAAKKAPAKKQPAKGAAATKVATKKTPAPPRRVSRPVPAPRTGKPSAFDLVGGDQP